MIQAVRFSFMAVSVCVGVLLAKLGYSTAAAVMSVFPGIFLTTMVMLMMVAIVMTMLLLLLLRVVFIQINVPGKHLDCARPRRADGCSGTDVVRLAGDFLLRRCLSTEHDVFAFS
jgi:hypothetical protein